MDALGLVIVAISFIIILTSIDKVGLFEVTDKDILNDIWEGKDV